VRRTSALSMRGSVHEVISLSARATLCSLAVFVKSATHDKYVSIAFRKASRDMRFVVSIAMTECALAVSPNALVCSFCSFGGLAKCRHSSW
jgi:uncharacterized PurR-regulated membrane protein YhhQ (DUF165 family)